SRRPDRDPRCRASGRRCSWPVWLSGATGRRARREARRSLWHLPDPQGTGDEVAPGPRAHTGQEGRQVGQPARREGRRDSRGDGNAAEGGEVEAHEALEAQITVPERPAVVPQVIVDDGQL